TGLPGRPCTVGWCRPDRQRRRTGRAPFLRRARGDRRRTDAFLLGGRAAPLRPAAPRLDGAGRPEPPGPPAGRTAGGDAGRSVSRTAAQPVGALPGCPLSVPRTGQSAVRLRRRGAASADLHLARTGTVAGRGTFPGAITAAQPRG